MPQVVVPEKYTADLKELAQRDDRAVSDILSEAMDAYISFRFRDPELTAPQQSHLQKSLAQAEAGKLISEQQVEAFFDEWEKEAASR